MTMSHIHSTAVLEEGATIGRCVRIGAYVRIARGAVVGDNVVLEDHSIVERASSVGDGSFVGSFVRIHSGVGIGQATVIEDGVAFSGLLGGAHLGDQHNSTRIGDNVRIGSNSTLAKGVSIGARAIVEAGAVLSCDVPQYAIVGGSPAYIKGYVVAAEEQRPTGDMSTSSGEARALNVPAAKLVVLPHIRDLRGDLTFGETGDQLPFVPNRIFSVFRVPSRQVRGEHAHRTCHQLLLCVSGSVSVMLDDGSTRDTVVLDNPKLALHIPPMVWASQYHYSPDATLVVLASDRYSASDYIRDYDEFLKAVTGRE